MNARERRRAIMAVLEGAKGPVSGSALAHEVGVSRQIVVQDIALLRADGHDIVATNRGYVLQEAPSSPAVPTRLVKVRHSVEQAGDELTSIVDAGGAVLNVIVNHRVYGKITADLDIRNRRDVERYLHDIESGKSFPLLTVTSGYHFHRIAAEDEQTLDEIEAMLAEGFDCVILDWQHGFHDFATVQAAIVSAHAAGAATMVRIGSALFGLAAFAFRGRKMASARNADPSLIEARNVGGHSWVAYGWNERS